MLTAAQQLDSPVDHLLGEPASFPLVAELVQDAGDLDTLARTGIRADLAPALRRPRPRPGTRIAGRETAR